MYNYKHVILVGIDGAGNFYRHTAAPMIRRVMAEGAGTDMCLTAIPSDSAQCWGSMLMGVTCRIHGLHNDKISSAAEPCSTEEHPTVFRMIRDAMPEATLGSFSNWNPINYGIIENGLGVHKDTASDGPLCDKICDYLAEHDPKFLFVQFDEVDQAGGDAGSEGREGNGEDGRGDHQADDAVEHHGVVVVHHPVHRAGQQHEGQHRAHSHRQQHTAVQVTDGAGDVLIEGEGLPGSVGGSQGEQKNGGTHAGHNHRKRQGGTAKHVPEEIRNNQ